MRVLGLLVAMWPWALNGGCPHAQHMGAAGQIRGRVLVGVSHTHAHSMLGIHREPRPMGLSGCWDPASYLFDILDIGHQGSYH
jgi:hypothetical protein